MHLRMVPPSTMMNAGLSLAFISTLFAEWDGGIGGHFGAGAYSLWRFGTSGWVCRNAAIPSAFCAPLTLPFLKTHSFFCAPAAGLLILLLSLPYGHRELRTGLAAYVLADGLDSISAFLLDG